MDVPMKMSKNQPTAGHEPGAMVDTERYEKSKDDRARDFMLHMNREDIERIFRDENTTPMGRLVSLHGLSLCLLNEIKKVRAERDALPDLALKAGLEHYKAINYLSCQELKTLHASASLLAAENKRLRRLLQRAFDYVKWEKENWVDHESPKEFPEQQLLDDLLTALTTGGDDGSR